MSKIREIILDYDSAMELASEVAVSSVISFTKKGPAISNEDYNYLKESIIVEIMAALGF